MKKQQKGFSLIELLIVVAIILIIAAIAIPNLLRARMAANEASAVGGLRTINTAEVTYFSTYNVGFGTLAQIGTPASGGCTASSANACLIDRVLTAGTKSGYTFVATPSGTGNSTYVSSAYAITQGQTGQREFCSDQSAVIYFNATASTCVQGTDSPI